LPASFLIRPSAEFRPITARVWNSSFCSIGSRSMREASIPCTVTGRRACEKRRTNFTAPSRAKIPCSNNDWTVSSMKNGLP
jgi:hypothetical protein